MAKVRTNFIEFLLKQALIGQEIYIDDNKKIVIDDINYQPIIKEVYIKSGDDGYKLSIDMNYDFELNFENIVKIVPNKGRIKGRNKER